MVKEFKDCIALAQYCLQVLGVEEDVTYHLSKWDPNNKEKYIGDAEVWNQTEAHIRQMLEELNIPFTEDVGEAAFYGPKVDINAKNVYGKEDTMITIQWDAFFLLNSLICTISTKMAKNSVHTSSTVHPWDAMREHRHG